MHCTQAVNQYILSPIYCNYGLFYWTTDSFRFYGYSNRAALLLPFFDDFLFISLARHSILTGFNIACVETNATSLTASNMGSVIIREKFANRKVELRREIVKRRIIRFIIYFLFISQLFPLAKLPKRKFRRISGAAAKTNFRFFFSFLVAKTKHRFKRRTIKQSIQFPK